MGTQAYLKKKSFLPSLRRSSRRSVQLICSLIPRLLSTHQENSMLVVQLLMPVLLEEKLLLTLMEDGALMVEVLSPVKIHLRSIDRLPTMEDLLLNLSSPTDLLTEFSFKFHMLLDSLIHYQSMLIHTVPSKKV